ncbi:hypothetical protein PanWU01x14_041710, partial [Parasponia andersonii]
SKGENFRVFSYIVIFCIVAFKLTYQTDSPFLFVAPSPYQGSCFAKQRVAVSIKIEKSWGCVSRFGNGFCHVIGVAFNETSDLHRLESLCKVTVESPSRSFIVNVFQLTCIPPSDSSHCILRIKSELPISNGKKSSTMSTSGSDSTTPLQIPVPCTDSPIPM